MGTHVWVQRQRINTATLAKRFHKACIGLRIFGSSGGQLRGWRLRSDHVLRDDAMGFSFWLRSNVPDVGRVEQNSQRFLFCTDPSNPHKNQHDTGACRLNRRWIAQICNRCPAHTETTIDGPIRPMLRSLCTAMAPRLAAITSAPFRAFGGCATGKNGQRDKALVQIHRAGWESLQDRHSQRCDLPRFISNSSSVTLCPLRRATFQSISSLRRHGPTSQ